MPQGEGTYGSKVGRPSKKRTSFVNDDGWTRRNRKQSSRSILTKPTKVSVKYLPKDAQHKEVDGMGIGQVTNYSYGETDRLYADRTGTLTPEEKYRAMKKKNNGS